MFAAIRAFFAERGVLEVDTAHLSHAAVTDPHLHSVRAGQGYLNTSPEYAMKRLLSAGSGDIYQLAHVFRGEEVGRRHLCEFMMLEWYRLGFDHHQLMGEVARLVKQLVPHKADLPVVARTYDELFMHFCGFDPGLSSDAAIVEVAEQIVPDCRIWALDRDGYLDLLFTQCIEPNLGQNEWTFVCNYPPSQAALSRIIEINGRQVAARFELYHQGLELCNGFWELCDAVEQRQRFIADNAARSAMGLSTMPVDEDFLAALATGLPECAGVALGVDRLLMLAHDSVHINQVQLLPIN